MNLQIFTKLTYLYDMITLFKETNLLKDLRFLYFHSVFACVMQVNSLSKDSFRSLGEKDSLLSSKE